MLGCRILMNVINWCIRKDWSGYHSPIALQRTVEILRIFENNASIRRQSAKPISVNSPSLWDLSTKSKLNRSETDDISVNFFSLINYHRWSAPSFGCHAFLVCALRLGGIWPNWQQLWRHRRHWRHIGPQCRIHWCALSIQIMLMFLFFAHSKLSNSGMVIWVINGTSIRHWCIYGIK